MGEIELTRGLVTIVDSDLLEWLNQWSWRAVKNDSTNYVVRWDYTNSNRCQMQMHRVIMEYSGFDVSGNEVDHKDGNGLDNRRQNLRIATHAQNMQNRKINTNNTSGYKGVWWNNRAAKWQAQITVNARRIHLGLFIDQIEAALAYDTAARFHFEEFARCNFPAG